MAEQGGQQKSKKTVVVGEEPFTGQDNETLQYAVDSLSYEGGGTVELPAGTYEMQDALYLRSGVDITGSGRETKLVRKPGKGVKLAEVAGYGHYEVVVEDPDGLEPGMGVFITDEMSGGFQTTAGTILDKKGHSIYLDEMLNAEYDPAHGARVMPLFPLVCGRYAENCSVSNVNLSGRAAEGQLVDGCRGAGVFLSCCHRINLVGVEVSDYPGDAISFQHCTDIAIEGSHVHANRGCGIHVGSGSVRHIIRNNNICENGSEGVLYALKSTHSLCEANQIHKNGAAGISIGERSTHHMFRSNEIHSNRGPGLLYRDARFHGGNSCVIHGNAFRRNCSGFGDADVVVGAGVQDLLFRRNFFYSDLQTPPDSHVARIGEGGARIHFFDNTIADQPLRADQIRDEGGSVTCEEPAQRPESGPAAAGRDAARHLGVDLPARWRDDVGWI